MALQQVQQVIQQNQSKSIKILLIGPVFSGRKTFQSIFQPEEQQEQFIGGKQFSILKQQQIQMVSYSISQIVKQFQDITCLILTVSSKQIQEYNSYIKQTLFQGLQQKQVQKILVLITHIDECYILTKDMIYSDIENEENREKVLVTETNLLLMDKIIESIDWIFEKLSGV